MTEIVFPPPNIGTEEMRSLAQNFRSVQRNMDEAFRKTVQSPAPRRRKEPERGEDDDQESDEMILDTDILRGMNRI